MKLNTYNDWDPLKEIIVGSATHYTSHNRELSFEVFFHDQHFKVYPRLTQATENASSGRTETIKQRYVEELCEDVENLAHVLASLGVTVHRPLTLAADTSPIAGFGWQASPVPALNIRDNTLIMGDEIIETPPPIRSRYLETRLLAPVFSRYYEQGAQWTTMPRPLLTDKSFDLSYARDSAMKSGGSSDAIDNPRPSPFDVGYEMMLDGAQCLRLGRDVIVNVANENHAKAVEWLERHWRGTYRIHRVWRMADNHIDSMILALRPGVFLARHPDIRSFMPPPFDRWKFIVPPEPDAMSFPKYDDGDLVLTSPYIDLNVLSIDTERVLVNEASRGLIDTLESEGFTPIPVRHRHRRLFGGGFHCFTLDTVRSGGMNDYAS